MSLDYQLTLIVITYKNLIYLMVYNMSIYYHLNLFISNLNYLTKLMAKYLLTIILLNIISED